MEREFNIKSQTPEAIETMLKSTKTALKIEIGDAFLPAKKQFNLSMIDFLNSIRKNMPELTQLAESLGSWQAGAWRSWGALWTRRCRTSKRGLTT